MITDKHWFKENILCLLSNAIKYSNGGRVNVTVTHIPGFDLGSQLSTDPGSENFFYNHDSTDNLISPRLNDYISAATTPPLGIPIPSDSKSPHIKKDHQSEQNQHESKEDLSKDEEPMAAAQSLPQEDGSLSDALIDEVAFSSEQEVGPQTRQNNSPAQSLSPTPTRGLVPRSTDMIIIAIEDEGIGIPEEARNHLFLPFKQVQRLAGGTGLGLYSLSNRMRALKGTRGVRSRSDGKQGSVFWFGIPYRPDLEHSSGTTSGASNLTSPHVLSRRLSLDPDPPSCPVSNFSQNQPVTASITDVLNAPIELSNLRFLVVDDSPSILKVLSRSLQSKKFIVETADNGSAGLDRLLKGYDSDDFDVVLMDLQMPVMDGIEAVRRYREFEVSQRLTNCAVNQNKKLHSLHTLGSLSSSLSLSIPAVASRKELLIIGMSANSDEDTKQCALNAGMNVFLAKPFTLKDLLPVLQRFVT